MVANTIPLPLPRHVRALWFSMSFAMSRKLYARRVRNRLENDNVNTFCCKIA